MNKLGFRAHDLGSFDTVINFISEMDNKSCPHIIQFAPTKLFKNITHISETKESWITSTSKSFKEANIEVSVLGCYINPLNTEKKYRTKVINDFKKSLEITKYFNNSVVATETGTNKNSFQLNLGEEKRLNNFWNFLEKVIPIAQKNNATIAIEPVADHTICSFKKIDQMLTYFKCDNLKLIYDPVNFLPYKDNELVPEFQNQQFIEFFEKYNSLISIIHLKDFNIVEEQKNGYLSLFSGRFNIEDFIFTLKKYNNQSPLLLENVNIPDIKNIIYKLQSLLN
jgi:sugar phosphate isomerase/epimerase